MGSISATDESPAFARQERLRFVESMVLWEGLVKRQRVCDVFGININHVTRDLRYYQDQFPDALDFRPELRGYIAGPKFKPHFASDAPTDYLGLLQAHADSGATALLPLMGGYDMQSASLPSPALGIDKKVLCDVVRAIRHQHGISVKYLAMSSERPSLRTLWPHALISTGLRWYVRVFDSESASFRSLVLARIETTMKVDTPCPSGPQNDTGWNERVTAHVIPNPQLNAHQQSVVAREFGMTLTGKKWLWSVELRQCLVGHFARRYRLDTKGLAAPESHWVVLRNPAELKPYFLPDGKE